MLGQNTDLTHGITLTKDGLPINVEEVEMVEISFDDLIKKYPSSDVSYENGRFLVHLTQEETQQFDDAVSVQVRVKFNNGDVPLSKIKTMPVRQSLSKEVL